MSLTKYAMPALVVGVLVLGIGTIGWRWFDSPGPADSIEVPRLSAAAAQGRSAFDANCASCHGRNATGTETGPPLVHDIYNPGHHSDAAFYRAAKIGVPRHHWPFGDMPPQPQVSDEELANIVRYVRELQQANGITYRPHRM